MNLNKETMLWIMICSVLIAAIILIIVLPENEREYKLEDKCGPIVNMISHTIPDESSCRTRCKYQCETSSLKYKRAEFEEKEVGCHICYCFCKEKLLS